jgi:hypothetical protein
VAATRAQIGGLSIARAVRWRPGGPWRQPDFVRLWAAQTMSVAGSQAGHVALPLTAVLWLQATAFEMGVLRALSAAPVLLFALFAGVWVDRMPRRPMLVIGDAGRALLLAAAAAELLALLIAYASPLRTLREQPADTPDPSSERPPPVSAPATGR